MSRWKKVARGVLGMGLTFGAIGAAFFSLVALAGKVFFPGAEDELGFMIIAGTVWGRRDRDELLGHAGDRGARPLVGRAFLLTSRLGGRAGRSSAGRTRCGR